METPRCRGRRAVVYDLVGATAIGGIGQSQMDIYHTVRKQNEREIGESSEKKLKGEEEKINRRGERE